MPTGRRHFVYVRTGTCSPGATPRGDSVQPSSWKRHCCSRGGRCGQCPPCCGVCHPVKSTVSLHLIISDALASSTVCFQANVKAQVSSPSSWLGLSGLTGMTRACGAAQRRGPRRSLRSFPENVSWRGRAGSREQGRPQFPLSATLTLQLRQEPRPLLPWAQLGPPQTTSWTHPGF